MHDACNAHVISTMQFFFLTTQNFTANASGLYTSINRPRMMEKLKVILHVGDTTVVKLWRFDPSKIMEYSQNEVEAMLIDLYPDVRKKGLRLEINNTVKFEDYNNFGAGQQLRQEQQMWQYRKQCGSMLKKKALKGYVCSSIVQVVLLCRRPT